MVAGVAAIDGVVAVGVGELAEVLVGMDEGFGVLCHVAEVHVVVGKAVDDEQASAKVLGTGDGHEYEPNAIPSSAGTSKR